MPGESLTVLPSVLDRSDAGEELKELGRADDGVGDAGGLDEVLLGDLCAKVSILGRPVRADNRKRDMVPSASRGLSREKIAARDLKNSSTAVLSNNSELERSITTCVPAMASLRPSPVIVLTPVLGEAAKTS